MTKQRSQSLAAGACLGAIGLFAAVEGSQFEFGNLMTVGPGILPLFLGLVMIGFGIFIATERSSPEGERSAPLKPLAAIFGSLLAFAILIRSAGLVPATFSLVLVAGLAEARFRPIPLLATAALLALFSYLVFIKALGVPFVPFVWLD